MIFIREDHSNKRVFLKFERMSDDIKYAIDQGLHDSGKLMYKDLRKGLKRGSRGGKVFKKGSQMIRRSKADEYPQRITGNLRGSVAFKVIGQSLEFGIKDPGKKGKTTKYAEYLEDGTKKKDGTKKMDKRLLVGHTTTKTKKDQINIFEKRMDSGVKKY